MWRSLGDKYDIERHDVRKHPRKIRTNKYLLVLLIVNFLVSGYSVNEAMTDILGNEARWTIIRMIVYAASALLVLVLGLLKYRKNDRETDMAMVVFFLLLIILLFTA